MTQTCMNMPLISKDLGILVVDDEELVLNRAVRILNTLGFDNVQKASDGSFALGLLEASETPVDLILCDLNMPEIDGIEFMRLATQNNFRGSLILLSGEDRRLLETAMNLARAHKINVLGAIQKPLDPVALESLLERLEPVSEEPGDTPQQPITRSELEAGLKNPGLEELTLYYQPKVNVRTGAITSVETLARWNHAERGLLGPDTFIPLAEKEGLINLLTFAIYKKALLQTADWLANGINIDTSVNFSINTFMLDKFPDFLLDIATHNGVNPGQVVLEITESQVMKDAVNCLEVLMRLRLKKFVLSIDDFGTGNSSMTQLKNIPFNELKIDRAFVYGAQHNSSARAILETSVELARKLDMTVVAEGAETREDWGQFVDRQP